MKKEKIHSGKPCESCNVWIKAVKGTSLCERCAAVVRTLNVIWKPTQETHNENTSA